MIRRVLKPLPEAAKRPLRWGHRVFAMATARMRAVTGREAPIQLVVCGYPRSGTSLLYNMLSATLPSVQFSEFEESAVHGVQMWGSRASKFPLDILELPKLLGRNFYKKRILVVIPLRDPRDIVTSVHPLLPDRYFIGFDHSWWPGRIGHDEWRYDAPGIRDVHKAIVASSDIPGVEVHKLRFEDLVADPDLVQADLASALGLRFSGPFSNYHATGRRLAYRYDGRREPKDAGLVLEDKAVERSRAGKWRAPEHRGRIREQFSKFPELFGIVRGYGYETDDAWFDVFSDGDDTISGAFSAIEAGLPAGDAS